MHMKLVGNFKLSVGVDVYLCLCEPAMNWWLDTVRQVGVLFLWCRASECNICLSNFTSRAVLDKNTGTTKIVAFSTFQSELSTCSWPPLVLGFCCCWALLCSSGFWLANVLWPAWVIYRLFFVCSALVPSQSAHMCDCMRTKCCQSTSWVYKEGHEVTSSSHMLPAWWRRRWREKKNEKNQLFLILKVWSKVWAPLQLAHDVIPEPSPMCLWLKSSWKSHQSSAAQPSSQTHNFAKFC